MSIKTARAVKWHLPVQPPVQQITNSQGAIAVSKLGAIEAWSDGKTVFYHIGRLDEYGATFLWGGRQTLPGTNGSGSEAPAVAINDAGIVVLIHQPAGSYDLYFYTGIADFAQEVINWIYIPTKNYDEGILPAVALNNLNQFIEVHQTQSQVVDMSKSLWGNFGIISSDAARITIRPLPQKHYDNGSQPRVALNDAGQVVEVHNSSNLLDEAGLMARIGTINFSNWSVDWQGDLKYDEGMFPCVALTADGDLLEVHQSQAEAPPTLWYWLGKPDFTNKKLNMTLHECLGWGYNPVIGASADGQIALQCIDADYLGNSTFYGCAATIETVSYGLSQQMLSLPYNQVIFPGTHNSYSNDSPNTESYHSYTPFTMNQHLSVTEQLNAGIRCLDFEIHPADPPFCQGAITYDALVFHGSGPHPEEADLGCTSLATLFTKVKEWAQSNPSEIVTVYCDYEEGFNNDSTIIKVLQDTGLSALVYNYNGSTIVPPSPYPTLQQMIDQLKTVMLFNSNLGEGENYFDDPANWCQSAQPTWNASVVQELAPAYLCLQGTNLSASLFRDSNFCSRRDKIDDFPWVAAGNPYQAGRCNQYYIVFNLAAAIINRRRTAVGNAALNWIWVDFAGTPAAPDYGLTTPFPPYGLLAAVYDLNQSQMDNQLEAKD